MIVAYNNFLGTKIQMMLWSLYHKHRFSQPSLSHLEYDQELQFAWVFTKNTAENNTADQKESSLQL